LTSTYKIQIPEEDFVDQTKLKLIVTATASDFSG